MQRIPRLRRVLLQAVLVSVTCAGVAQGPPGGVPPGQAKKYGDDGKGMPPGQAKKYFRDEDRDHFYVHYRQDADRWRDRRRPVFVPGQYIERQYIVQPVPRAYWVGVAAPPAPGYAYGYYGGYVVAYNPTTRIIADVLDLVVAASSR